MHGVQLVHLGSHPLRAAENILPWPQFPLLANFAGTGKYKTKPFFFYLGAFLALNLETSPGQACYSLTRRCQLPVYFWCLFTLGAKLLLVPVYFLTRRCQLLPR
jgi:hypothetical protein